MGMSKVIKLTPELTHQIVSAIRSGGYPHVAAETWGVSKELFDDWLKRGNAKNARAPYRSFAREVRQAFAHARLCAEMLGFKNDPKAWLIHGPGRESEQRPGWSVSVKPAEASAEGRNVLCDPELMALLRMVLEVLRPFPEARSQLTEALTKIGIGKEKNDGKTSVQDAA